MTLVCVLIGSNGIVMCADTQETIGSYAKKSVDKLTVWDMPNHSFRFAIAAATDDFTYVEMLERHLSASLLALGAWSMAEAEKTLSDTLTEFYSKHIWPQTTKAPLIEFLIAMQPLPSGRCEVFHISGTAVSIPSITSEPYKNIGIGAYLADYIFPLLLMGGDSQSELTMAAVYTAQQVHNNVDGVGPVARVVLLGNAGEYDELGPVQIKEIEANCFSFGDVISQAFMIATDEERSDSEVTAELNYIVEELREIRSRNVSYWQNVQQEISKRAKRRKQRDEHLRRRAGNQ